MEQEDIIRVVKDLLDYLVHVIATNEIIAYITEREREILDAVFIKY